MTDPVQPDSTDAMARFMEQAAGERKSVAISGGGTRSGLGRPIHTDYALNTGGLTGVTLYEPAELVLSARAGTPVADVEKLLADNNQMLPFEPMDHRTIYGTNGTPSMGALAACNISGPRRIQTGAARDSLIGVQAINGKGEQISSGGRVMKNVTGYDLVKLLAGSHGTLAILTDVTFKLLPRPETEQTLVLHGLSVEDAVAALCEAMGTPFEVSGAAHIPGTDPRTLLRVEGFAPSVVYRLNGLTEELSARGGEMERLSEDASRQTWSEIRDVKPLLVHPAASLWRVSLKPTETPDFLRALNTSEASVRTLLDWSGGLAWLAFDTDLPDGGASLVRGALEGLDGHATLTLASEDIRQNNAVFQPLASPLMQISRSLKNAFDPHGLLNPGRMYEGL
ncbi:glycolate oxidase subunit GlcE [Coralliovum pocilloporae]|uniref:glycolate oxidase subunit GlcE n=1 Tax=Coralliovum pocilloporae TaxID=3066369 RepID=UPI0033072C74